MSVEKDVKRKLYLTELMHISYLETYSVHNEKVLLTHRAVGDSAIFAARPHRPGFWQIIFDAG